MIVGSPYSRSRNAIPGCVKKLFSRSRSSRNFEQPWSRYSMVQRERERRHQVQQRQYAGPDPTLPHLKYGIFRQNNIRDRSRNQSPMRQRCKRSTVIPSECTTNVTRDWKRSPHGSPRRSNLSSTVFREVPKISNVPISYVIRCAGARYRQLSVCPSTHVDIKPQAATHVANSYSLPFNQRLSMHDGHTVYTNRHDPRNQNEVPKRRYNSVIFAKKLTKRY